MAVPNAAGELDPVALEESLMTTWREEDTFTQQVTARKDGKPFIFLEGPPTANGKPGIHHVVARTYKDLVCRWKAMEGHFVERKGGWDTHGLPIELGVEKELNIIIDMKYEGYFLIVSDFIKWAKDNNIPVGPGRGSGAGSLVAWALNITDLDPIKFGLIFERFLNPERVSLPDFDIDFCRDGRDKVLENVHKKYGKNKVAQIITFGKLQARAVIRDVGRVLGIPYGQVDSLCKLMPFDPSRPMSLQGSVSYTHLTLPTKA